jgi:beta-galactosidase
MALPKSYNYEAAISKASDLTYKWQRMKAVIGKHRPGIPAFAIKNTTKKTYGRITLAQSISLCDAIATVATTHKESTAPLTFEALRQDYRFVLYRTETAAGSLSLGQVNDCAWVFIDEGRHWTIERRKETIVTVPAGKFDILVENMGRVNHGKNFFEFKKLVKAANLGGKAITKWDQYRFDLTKTNKLKWGSVYRAKPGFFRATFTIDEVANTFLNPAGWKKGVTVVNGWNLGRFWHARPQSTLFVPHNMLKSARTNSSCSMPREQGR